SSLRALQLIERQRPGFLAAVNVFAGTSAGGINALLMAASASREQGLERGIDLWSENPFDPSLVRMVSGALGCISMYGNEGFVEALRPIFLDTTLGDLAARNRFVIVPSFQLKGREDRVPSWEPVVYHNLGESPYLDVSVLDVSLRTSAAPVFLPIYQGHVDGGMFANNPGMAALARVMANPLRGGGRGVGAQEIRLLSVGTGQRSSYLAVEDAAWGWQQWLFDPRRPLALIEAFFSAGTLEIDEQCRTILGTKSFFRLNPLQKIDGSSLDLDLEDQYLPDGSPGFERLKTILQEVVEHSPELNPDANGGRVPAVLHWLHQAGWIEEPRDDREKPGAPAAPRQRRATKAKPG
ncbi:MAG TPA: patatin-like phospholipase family protein, partial [Thermoanaerobaculia bacterium]